VPATRRYRITVFGGGAGGRNTTGNGAEGAPGGGGSGNHQLELNLTVGQVIPITVGAGGAAATNGGSSSFGTHLTTEGGKAAPSISAIGQGGGIGGKGALGVHTAIGGGGGGGGASTILYQPTNDANGNAGGIGISPGANGGFGGTQGSSDGQHGNAPGGGGGGARQTAGTARTGGRGGDGAVIIERSA